jgi:RNA polymerase sigma-70 factor (ECF subfamily)
VHDVATMEPGGYVAHNRASVDFGRLVAAEQAVLLRIALRLSRDRDEARDLVQSALADAWERLDELRDPAAAPGWLRRILVSRALNHLRRRRLWGRLRELFGAEVEPRDSGALIPPDADLASRQRLARIGLAVQRLPARQAAAFTLRYVEGLGLDEVADALSVGRGTAKTHLHRALVSLRATLGAAEAEEQP